MSNSNKWYQKETIRQKSAYFTIRDKTHILSTERFLGGKKMNRVKLEKGIMDIYDFGGVKLHSYKTNDFIDDEVFLIEKNKKLVIIESPCFYDNHKELEEYISNLDVTVEGMLLSYHMAGGTFLKDVKKYATKNADEYGHNGGGKGLVDNFTKAFGEIFDNTIHTVTNHINEGSIEIAGINMNIIPTAEGFDIEIPEINVIYTHMLGEDCHSIVAGHNHADAIINTLKGYKQKGYQYILTSHYTPEELKAVDTKIAYLEDIKQMANESTNKEELKEKVIAKYGNYSGENYLDMTVGFFFN